MQAEHYRYSDIRKLLLQTVVFQAARRYIFLTDGCQRS